MACSSCSQPLPDGARFCPFCGTRTAATADEERRLVTVVFADIVGYTGLVEYVDPERAKRLLDDAFERLIADVVEYGGTVDKVLGDGVLALFGAPVAHEDDTDRAIRAALKMHESLAAFVVERDEITRAVELRIGVNTGEVLFGRVGGTDGYTVMGDVVNVAARLQALAHPGEIYLGDLTASLASPSVLREVVDQFPVRGREQSERVWRVVGLDRSRVDLQVGRDTPFVGRLLERSLLDDALQQVIDGDSATVALVGEAGSGKSRLIAEALDAARDDITLLVGACAPYGQTNVWAPLASAMFGTIDVAMSLSADKVREMSRHTAVTEYGFRPDDPLLGWLVEGALHIAGHGSSFDHVPPAQARETLFRLIVESFRRRTELAPLVLCIDDLHWADNVLIDVLHRIRRSLADRPFLLITAQRDDARIDWPPTGADPVTKRIQLDPLNRSEADDLVLALLGEAPPPVLADRLYDRSGGNPLFLTELAALAKDGGDSIDLPSSLRVLIAARLDRLDSPSREIIDNAAVLGMQGPVISLERFAIEAGQEFSTEALAGLERAGLLVLTTGRWRFRSDVVREVAYQTLTKVARAERHAAVATVMARRSGAPIGLLAHHTARAAELNREIGPLDTIDSDITERAVALMARAARRSLEVGAFRQARREVDRALALGSERADVERRLLLLRATSSNELREYDPGSADALRALDSAVEHGDRHDEGMARRLVGIEAHGAGDLPTARRELDRSIEIFRELDDDSELAISLADRGFCEIFGGSLARADALLDESEALAEKLGDRRSGAWAREHKALSAFMSGDTRLAGERLAVALREFEELGDRGGTSWAQALSAYLAFYERRFDDAERLADDARTEASKLGERWGPAMMDNLVASIRLWSGQFTEADRLSRQALATFRELGDRFGLVQALAPHLRSQIALGLHAEAIRGIEEALALSESSGSLAFPAMAAAGAAVHLGVGDRAVVVAERAVALNEEMGANAAETRTTLGLALCQAGRSDDAIGSLLDVEAAGPYTNAVTGLAFALVGDPEASLERAGQVTGEAGASYLDQVIAAVAAVGALLGAGRRADAADRLAELRSLVTSIGDVVTVGLCDYVAAALLDDPSSAASSAVAVSVLPLGAGWARVVDDLAAVAV